MKYTAQEICDSLGIDLSDILNIYPYGSQVYGNNTEESDYDFIIVYRKSILPSGSFKDNAISSKDGKIQGICYSRGGFIDAINNYQISALECIFLPEDLIIKKTWDFKITKYFEKDMIKNIIQIASASWHSAYLSYSRKDFSYAKKNAYHALRILDFGLQLKNNQKIVNYKSANKAKESIYKEEGFNYKAWHDIFILMSNTLKTE